MEMIGKCYQLMQRGSSLFYKCMYGICHFRILYLLEISWFLYIKCTCTMEGFSWKIHVVITSHEALAFLFVFLFTDLLSLSFIFPGSHHVLLSIVVQQMDHSQLRKKWHCCANLLLIHLHLLRPLAHISNKSTPNIWIIAFLLSARI